MHAHLRDVLARLDESRDVLRAAVERVPEPRRRTRPGPDRWSVTEIIEHLALVNRFFADRMAEAITRAKAGGLGSESSPRDGLPLEVARQMRDRGQPRAAREALSPTGRLATEEALADLEASRDAMRAAILTGDGLALGDVTADHRLFGTLTIYQWVELTAAHEIRHADQIREVGEALETGA